MERKSFSVGVAEGLHEFRREAEDRIARVCFGRRNRKDVPKMLLYEFIWSQISISTDESTLAYFGTAKESDGD